MSIYLVGYTQLKIDTDHYAYWDDFVLSDEHGYFATREKAEVKIQELNQPQIDRMEKCFALHRKERARATAYNKKVDENGLESGEGRLIVPDMPQGENSLKDFLLGRSREWAIVWEVLELPEEDEED